MMVVDERRRLEMFERLGEVFGVEVAETVLAHLPSSGARVATAGQVDRLRWDTSEQIERLRLDTSEQIERLRLDTSQQIERLRLDTSQQIEQLREEMNHRFELYEARLAARWRRDLLLLAGPQFLVLLGIILSLNL